MSNTVLSLQNAHKHDSTIQFFENGHKYEVLHSNIKYTSVTTWVHYHFSRFNADMIIKSMLTGKIGDPLINIG